MLELRGQIERYFDHQITEHISNSLWDLIAVSVDFDLDTDLRYPEYYPCEP